MSIRYQVPAWVRRRRMTRRKPRDLRREMNYYVDGMALAEKWTAGVAEQLLRGAPGEHMLTASDVDAMGGGDALYRFREALRLPEPEDDDG